MHVRRDIATMRYQALRSLKVSFTLSEQGFAIDVEVGPHWPDRNWVGLHKRTDVIGLPRLRFGHSGYRVATVLYAEEPYGRHLHARSLPSRTKLIGVSQPIWSDPGGLLLGLPG
jgi:hypothetical protein